MTIKQQPDYTDSSSHIYREYMYVPEHPVRRWLLPLVIGLGAFVLGVGIGASGPEQAPADCTAMGEEYAALVSEGVDAGMSMDEEWIADVADQRDDMRERLADMCG